MNTTPSTGASRRNPRRRRPSAAPTGSPRSNDGRADSNRGGSNNNGGGDSAVVDLTPVSDPVAVAADFTVLNVPAPIVAALSREGVIIPFPIQTATPPS